MVLNWADFLPSIIFNTNPILDWSSSSHVDIHTIYSYGNSTFLKIILPSLEYAHKDAVRPQVVTGKRP